MALLEYARFRLAERRQYLFGGVFQPFHHGEDEEGRNQAKHNKDRPQCPKRHVSPQHADDGNEVVADCSGAKPQAHHESFVLGRGNLGYERYAHRGKEQLCEGEYQISTDKHGGRDKQVAVHHGCTIGIRGRKSHGGKSHDSKADGGYNHADAYLARCGGFFSSFGKCAEHCKGDRREGNNEEGVELLEHLGENLNGRTRFQGQVFPYQEDNRKQCHGS